MGEGGGVWGGDAFGFNLSCAKKKKKVNFCEIDNYPSATLEAVVHRKLHRKLAGQQKPEFPPFVRMMSLAMLSKCASLLVSLTLVLGESEAARESGGEWRNEASWEQVTCDVEQVHEHTVPLPATRLSLCH